MKRRFGVLVPPVNVAVENEFSRFLPPTMEMHVGRLLRRELVMSAESQKEMLASAEPVSESLMRTQPEVLLFCCTSASFMDGLGKDIEISSWLEELTGVPAATTSTAVVKALKDYGARRILLFTPYSEDYNALARSFFEQNGFKVEHLLGFHCKTPDITGTVESSRVAEMLLRERARVAEVDAVFISCCNLHAMDQVAMLEAELGKPVLTSNSCTLWWAIDRMGLAGTHLGLGRAFDGIAAGRSGTACDTAIA
jgi:maleate isomerase